MTQSRFVIIGGKRAKFEEVRKGQHFELYESDGKFIAHCIAKSDPYINDQSMWEIETITEQHDKHYDWLTFKLEKYFPFKGKYYEYSIGERATPAQVAESIIIAIVVGIVAEILVCVL